ncbi:jg11622, partial [Pararge aegeria aegeria]
RTISRAPRFVRNQVIARDLCMESLDEFIHRLSASMFARADGARTQHLRGIAPYHRRPPDARGLPRDLLDI